MKGLVDFSDCDVLVNTYDGADSKLKIVYDNQIYMLKLGEKLEPNPKNPLQASYSNSPVSEYLGSHIAQLFGIPAQETVLGTYRGAMAVACFDFIRNREDSENFELVEFKKLESSHLGSSSAGGRTPTYDTLVAVLEDHPDLEGLRQDAADRYWNTFVLDSLIGNFDRHAGNWGYVLDKRFGCLVDIAPVYDCGSSFYPRLDETAMADMLRHPQKLEERTEVFPRAALRVGGEKAFYHKFFLSHEGEAARAALVELSEQVDFGKIHELIQDTPGISPVRREFYSACVDVRREKILEPALALGREELAHKREQDRGYSLGSMCKAASEAKDGACVGVDKGLGCPGEGAR